MSSDVDAAEAVRQRLQADLRAAMKGRRMLEVDVLRALIAAIDNAGAVPLARGFAPRQHEIERRRLTLEEVEAILAREFEVRRTAAHELARLGRREESGRASREMTFIARYLSAPPRIDD